MLGLFRKEDQRRKARERAIGEMVYAIPIGAPREVIHELTSLSWRLNDWGNIKWDLRHAREFRQG